MPGLVWPLREPSSDAATSGSAMTYKSRKSSQAKRCAIAAEAAPVAAAWPEATRSPIVRGWQDQLSNAEVSSFASSPT